jgi:putative endonuclease
LRAFSAHTLPTCLSPIALATDVGELSTVGNTYYVHIITNRRNGTLYAGVTNSLERRVWQHKHKMQAGFSAKYGLGRLVYFESYRDISNAIAREKQIKAGSRSRKLALIENLNPEWRDLSEDWYC